MRIVAVPSFRFYTEEDRAEDVPQRAEVPRRVVIARTSRTPALRAFRGDEAISGSLNTLGHEIASRSLSSGRAERGPVGSQ